MRYRVVRYNEDGTNTLLGNVYARSDIHAHERFGMASCVVIYPLPIGRYQAKALQMELEMELVESQEKLARTVKEFATRVISQMGE